MSELQDRLQSALGDAFRLEREITGGGMSRLFLASEASLNRQVVIKLLPPDMASEVSAARFKQEIELAAHLQHPNILPVLTAGSRDDLIYYVMPYVTGESLRHRLTAHGRLPIEEARKILAEVADALAHAHAQGVVHRDIKPENILLQHGHAVLTDFGVARAVAEAQSGGRLTQTGMAVGTPGYMSPEQVAGETHIDARADVYALAVVAYEILTGQQPFTGTSMQAVLAAHLTETARPVTDLRADTPVELTATITKALAKNPAERLQSAAEFRDAVGIRTGDQLAARPRKTRWALGAGMAAVVAAIAAVILWPKGWHVDGDPRQSLIVFPFENQTGDAALDWLEDGSMNLLGLGLAHWEDLRVFDDERTSSLLRRRNVESAGDLDFELAQRMAMEANVGTLVLGDFRYEGDSLVVQAKVHDVASGNRLSTEIARTGRAEDPRSVLDALVGRILNVSGAPIGERPGVTAQTTHSLEAYRLYLGGVERLQQFQLDSAQTLLEEAVALDSTFAMAYLQLRTVDGWRATGGDPARQLSLIEDARRYSQNLPARYRSFIDIYSAASNAQWQRSGQLAAELIARDSSDAQAWYEYGEAHFHGDPSTFGGSGNQGTALRAFQRALAIDSAMVIAYRHIMDVLGSCDNRIENLPAGQSTFVCLADSAVYGTRSQLEDLLGREEIERRRVEAEETLLRTARQWVAAAPSSYQARDRYLLVALTKGRYEEAKNQTEILRERGDTARALAFRAAVLYGQHEFVAAADTMEVAWRNLPSDFGAPDMEQSPFAWAMAVFGAAGRTEAAQRAVDTTFGRWSGRAPDRLPIFGPDGPLVPKQPLIDLFTSIMGTNITPLRNGKRDWDALQAFQQHFPRDTTILRRTIAALGMQVELLFTAMLSGDDEILRRLAPLLPEAQRELGNAILTLSQGDATAATRMLAAIQQRRASEDHIAPAEAGLWAAVAARLGRTEDAIDLYAYFEEIPLSGIPGGTLVRSWAERGALYQQLGDESRAIEMYEKVIEALETGDAEVQPLVDRARDALAALTGETAPRRR